MTKNAITVIDQQLIDWFDSWFCCDDDLLIFEQFGIDEKTKDLLQMAKDLIEINAELTKREQKYKGAIKDLINDIRNSDNSRCNEVINSHLFCGLNELLKGDSDE